MRLDTGRDTMNKPQGKPVQEEVTIKKPRVIVNEVKNHFDPVNQIVETFEKKGITLSKVYKINEITD